ncbi:hypothetical protein HWV62_34473 [Athelia sp. TMB]|nr:hypothetical protein HWV62_34473 [Athelia sp. TMB]
MRDRTLQARHSYHPYARVDLKPVRGALISPLMPNSEKDLDGEAEITDAQSVRWIPLAEREANECHQDSTGLHFEGCRESYRASSSSHSTPIPELMYPPTRAPTPAPSGDTARLSTSSAPDNSAGVGCSPTGPVLISDEAGTVVERELVPGSKEGHEDITATPHAENLGKELTPSGTNHDGQDRKGGGTEAKSASVEYSTRLRCIRCPIMYTQGPVLVKQCKVCRIEAANKSKIETKAAGKGTILYTLIKLKEGQKFGAELRGAINESMQHGVPVQFRASFSITAGQVSVDSRHEEMSVTYHCDCYEMRKLHRVENDFGVATKELSMAPADVKPCGGTITVTVIQNILGEHKLALEIDHETGKVVIEGVEV